MFLMFGKQAFFTNYRSSTLVKKCFGKHRISLCGRNQITLQDETVTAHFRIFNGSLLQITQAKISNVKSNDFLTICLLFDSPSQRTYNTNNLRIETIKTIRTEQTFVGLEDVFKTSSRDVFTTSSTRLLRNNFTSSKAS